MSKIILLAILLATSYLYYTVLNGIRNTFNLKRQSQRYIISRQKKEYCGVYEIEKDIQLQILIHLINSIIRLKSVKCFIVHKLNTNKYSKGKLYRQSYLQQ